MTILYRTTISAIGEEAGDLLDEGILILFADGAPPELAEVSVLHRAEPAEPQDHAQTQLQARPPVPGDTLAIGDDRFAITAVGASAWEKIAEIGHVVFSFNAAAAAERPGEICVETAPPERLRALLQPGAPLSVVGR